MPWHCLSRSLQGKALSKTAKTLLHYALWGEARGGPHLDFHSVRRFYKAAQLSSSSLSDFYFFFTFFYIYRQHSECERLFVIYLRKKS